jgi:hypothetical protein
MEKRWSNILQKLGASYHATMGFGFCILKKIKNGIVFTIFGLITMALPCDFLRDFLENRGKKW